MKQLDWNSIIFNDDIDHEFYKMPLAEAKELGYIFEKCKVEEEDDQDYKISMYWAAPVNQLEDPSINFFNSSICPFPNSMCEDLERFSFCEIMESCLEIINEDEFVQYINDNYPNCKFTKDIIE